MATYIISIGGSGARIMRSFLFLAAGNNQSIQNTRIKILAIDSDTEPSSAQTKFNEVLESYQHMHSRLRGDSTFFPCEVSVETYNPTSENGVEIGGEQALTFIQYLTDSRELLANNTDDALDANFLKLFFADSQEGLGMNIQKGFYGSPNIGGTVFSSTPRLSNKVDEWLGEYGNQGDKIIILGSLFGGVGAAGIPQIVNIIRESNLNNINEAEISGIFVLPYFSVRDNDLAAQFLGKTKSALQYYEGNLNNEFAKILYIGENPPSITYENKPDGNYNSPHQVDLFAALGVIHIMNNSLNGLPKFYEYWRKMEAEAAKTDLSHIILKNDVDKNTWNSFVSFSFLMNFFDGREFNKLKGEIYGIAYNKIAAFFQVDAVSGFKRYYLEWLSDLNRNGGFAPFNTLGNDENYADFIASLSNHFNALNSRRVMLGRRRPLLERFRAHQNYLEKDGSTVLKFLDLAISDFPGLPDANLIGDQRKRYIVYNNEEIDANHGGSWGGVNLANGWMADINANINNDAIRISASIPTMFAQIYLYKSAFENKDLNLYTDVLDMMELMYAYPERIKLDIWYRGNPEVGTSRISILRNRGYTRLADVIDTFWGRDLDGAKEMVLIYYIDNNNNEHLLGGVSKLNLFFPSPNWMGSAGQQEVAQLQRVADNNTAYHLFVPPTDNAPNRELVDRDSKFTSYLRKLFDNGNNTPVATYVREQVPVPAEGEQQSNMELLEILVNFVNRQNDYDFLSSFESGNYLFFNKHLMQLCPVNDNGTLKYLVGNGQSIISIDDVFEEELLYLEDGIVDLGNFSYPPDVNDVKYLLPFKTAFFDVFNLQDVTVSGSVENGYFFQINKMIEGRNLILSRMFNVKEINKIPSLNLGIFPAYLDPIKRWVFLEGGNVKLDVITNTENVRYERGTINTNVLEIKREDNQRLQEDSVKYIQITRLDDTGNPTGRGLLQPKFVEKQATVDQIAIDFGTTNTQFAWKSGNDRKRDFGAIKLSLNLLKQPLDTDTINSEFIPYNSHFPNPFKSILRRAQNNNTLLFDSTSIAWNPIISERMLIDHVFNVKWDITNTLYFKAMLRELIAVADAINKDAKILVTYPFAMGDLEMYKDKWMNIAKEFDKNEIKIKMNISESVAPLFYFDTQGGDGFINVDIGGKTVDIALFSPALAQENIAQRINFSASFVFGANYLWKNPVWKGFIGNQLAGHMDGIRNEDVMSFFFSQANTESLIDPLRARNNRDNKHRGLLIHFLAISYMVGKTFAAKINELMDDRRRSFKLTFTGNGSKYLGYLGDRNQLQTVFTAFINASFPDVFDNVTFNLEAISGEKIATVEGRLKIGNNPNIAETQVVIIGNTLAVRPNERIKSSDEIENVLKQIEDDFKRFFKALRDSKVTESISNELFINFANNLEDIVRNRFNDMKDDVAHNRWEAMAAFGINRENENQYRFSDSPFWEGIKVLIADLLQ